MRQEKLDWLQALRGIAALLVVLTHARYFLRGTPSEHFAESLFFPGALGVDLFFLISGFIMVHSTSDADGTALYTVRFLAKRLARIVPVYVVIATLGILLTKDPVFFTELVSLKELVKSFLFLPVDAADPPYYGLPWAIGWTLNFEVTFYIIFAVSMLAGPRLRWLAFASWLVFFLIAVPKYTTGDFSFNPLANYGFELGVLNQLTNGIIWLFPLGVVAGLLYHSRIRLSGPIANGLIAVSTAAALFFAYSGVFRFHGVDGWGGPIAIAFIVLSICDPGRISVPPFLSWMGKVSFSLYLVHPIAQNLTANTLRNAGLSESINTWAFVLFTTTLALALAAVSYAALESRLSDSVRHWLLEAINKASRLRLRVA